MYTHSMVLSHITYCLSTWSHGSTTTLKPLESLYKQTLKILDKQICFFASLPNTPKIQLAKLETSLNMMQMLAFFTRLSTALPHLLLDSLLTYAQLQLG